MQYAIRLLTDEEWKEYQVEFGFNDEQMKQRKSEATRWFARVKEIYLEHLQDQEELQPCINWQKEGF